MSNDLIAIEPKNVMTVFTQDNGLDDIIKQIEMEVLTFEHDLSNDARRKKTASLARKVASTKTYLDNLGKDLVSEWKSKSKVVDANRKLMRERLDELRDLARKPLTEWEEEQARAEAERLAAEEAEKLRLQIESDHEIALLLNEKFDRELAEKQERELAEEKARQEAIAKAQAEREDQIRKDAEEKAKRDAELAAKAAEEEKRLAIERAEQAQRAEARAKIEAELAEKRRIEAEAKAKRDAEEAAERARLAEIKRQEDAKKAEEAEKARLEANKKHCAAIHNSIVSDLVLAGLDESTAKLVVTAIAKKQVKNVVINY